MGATYSKKIRQRTGGVQTWEETNDLAKLLGDNPETLAGNLLKLRPGSPLNAAEITAAKNLLVSQHKKLTGLAKQLQTETGDNTKTALEFARQHALTAELTKVYKGAQTEIARALNILKEPVQEGKVINLKLDQLNRNNILMNYGGAKTAKKVAELYLETPGLIKKINFAEKSFLSKSSDALVEVFLNNILSGTLTHVKNIGGNWIYKALERAERVYAARMYGGKSIDSVAEFEDVAQAFGEHIVTSNMIKAFNSKLFTINTLKNPLKNFPGFESKISGTKFESPVHAFSAQEFGIKRFIYFQTALCYGLKPEESPITLNHPRNPQGSSYAISKTASELYLELSGLDYVTFRLANVIGPRNVAGPLPIFYQRLKDSKKCFVTRSRRDFVFVKDLAKKVISACDGIGSGAYHFSSGKDVEILKLYNCVVDAMGLTEYPSPEIRNLSEDDVESILLDPSRTFEDFGKIEFTPIEKTVKEGINYFKKFGTLGEYTHLKIKN